MRYYYRYTGLGLIAMLVTAPVMDAVARPCPQQCENCPKVSCGRGEKPARPAIPDTCCVDAASQRAAIDSMAKSFVVISTCACNIGNYPYAVGVVRAAPANTSITYAANAYKNRDAKSGHEATDNAMFPLRAPLHLTHCLFLC